MIKKFLAFILTLVFLTILPILLLVQSITATYLNEPTLVHTIVPATYQPLTSFLAQQFAENPQDAALFETRIRTVLSQDIYNELVGTAAHEFFKTNGTVIDTASLKKRLQEVVPARAKLMPVCTKEEGASKTFRFCRPAQLPVGSPEFAGVVSDAIDKQIPPKITIGNKDYPQVAEILKKVFTYKDYVASAIVVSGVFLLLLIGLVIFSPWSSVLKWMGAAVIQLAAVMWLLVASLDKIPDLASKFSSTVTPAQKQLIVLFLSFPAAEIMRWVYLFGIPSVALIVIGFILHSPKSPPLK